MASPQGGLRGADGLDTVVNETDREEALVLDDTWSHEDGLVRSFMPDVRDQDVAPLKVGLSWVFTILRWSLVGLSQQGVGFFPRFEEGGLVLALADFFRAQGDFFEFTRICPSEVEVVVESSEFIFAFEDSVDSGAAEKCFVERTCDELGFIQFAGDGIAAVAELERAVDAGIKRVTGKKGNGKAGGKEVMNHGVSAG